MYYIKLLFIKKNSNSTEKENVNIGSTRQDDNTIICTRLRFAIHSKRTFVHTTLFSDSHKDVPTYQHKKHKKLFFPRISGMEYGSYFSRGRFSRSRGEWSRRVGSVRPPPPPAIILRHYFAPLPTLASYSISSVASRL